MENNPQLSVIDENGIKQSIGEIKSETIEINQEPSNRIQWYGVFPYDEIIKTSDQEPYLFALLLNDKLVAIGGENRREGGVFNNYNLIFNSWVDLRKTLSKHKKQVERINDIIKHARRKIAKSEIDRARNWEKLFELIKGKKFIGKRELPPQPRQMLYRTTWDNEMYIIYENRWKQPKRFSLWNSDKEFFANSDKLSDMTNRLSNIVRRQITLVQ